MSDDLDPRLREELLRYHEPGETPRERIWEGIQARRARRRPRLIAGRRWVWPVAAAALLILGVALGRMSAPSAPPGPAIPVAEVAPEPARPSAYRVAAADHLQRAELLLTRFASGPGPGEPTGDAFARWAEGLLVETRLLLDSPAGRDPEVRVLLRDLELVLARMARLANGEAEQGRRELSEQLDRGSLLLRLRTTLPAAPAPDGA